MKRNWTVAFLMAFASACVIGLVITAYAPPESDTQFVQNALYGLAGVAIGIVGGLLRSPGEAEASAPDEMAKLEVKLAELKTRSAINEIEVKKEEAKEEVRAAKEKTVGALSEVQKLERDAKKQRRHEPPNAPWANFETAPKQEDMVYGEPVDYDRR